MLFRKLLCSLVLLGLASIAGADTVFKCVGPDGKVTWSNQPCPPAAKVQVLEVRPNVVSSDGLRGWAERNPAGRMASTPSAASGAAPAGSGRVYDPLACSNAKHAYEFEAGYRYRKYDLLQAKAREVYENCGYWP